MKGAIVNFICAGFIALSLAACVEGDTTDPTGVKVAFAVVQTGQFSGIVAERLEVIRSQEDFTELWLAHGEGFSSAPVQPDVDFGQRMVVAAFLGERATGGFSIAVTEVEDREDSLLVNLRVTLPGANCVVAQAHSQPHQIISVPLFEKMVVFTTEVERVDCPL